MEILLSEIDMHDMQDSVYKISSPKLTIFTCPGSLTDGLEEYLCGMKFYKKKIWTITGSN